MPVVVFLVLLNLGKKPHLWTDTTKPRFCSQLLLWCRTAGVNTRFQVIDLDVSGDTPAAQNLKNKNRLAHDQAAVDIKGMTGDIGGGIGC